MLILCNAFLAHPLKQRLQSLPGAMDGRFGVLACWLPKRQFLTSVGATGMVRWRGVRFHGPWRRLQAPNGNKINDPGLRPPRGPPKAAVTSIFELSTSNCAIWTHVRPNPTAERLCISKSRPTTGVGRALAEIAQIDVDSKIEVPVAHGSPRAGLVPERRFCRHRVESSRGPSKERSSRWGRS